MAAYPLLVDLVGRRMSSWGVVCFVFLSYCDEFAVEASFCALSGVDHVRIDAFPFVRSVEDISNPLRQLQQMGADEYLQCFTTCGWRENSLRAYCQLARVRLE